MNKLVSILSALLLFCGFTNDPSLTFNNVTYKRYPLQGKPTGCREILYDEIRFQRKDSTHTEIQYYQSGRNVSISPFYKPLKEPEDSTRFNKEAYRFFMRDERIYSEPFVFKAGFREYTVYAQKNYNCYDPMCGQRHGHIRMYHGTTWIMEEFGPVLMIEEGTSVSILNHAETIGHPPKVLMEQLLLKANVPEAISQDYLSGISEW